MSLVEAVLPTFGGASFGVRGLGLLGFRVKSLGFRVMDQGWMQNLRLIVRLKPDQEGRS